jgi:large subunit ribosomal protein L23
MKNAYDIVLEARHHRAVHGRTEQKKYVFKVALDANKIEIKKAIEEIFGVKVEKVNTLRMEGKKAPGLLSRRPPRQLEKGHGQADRRFQDHRVLRRYGLRRSVTQYGD